MLSSIILASVSATQSELSSISVTQLLASVSVAQSERSSVSVTQSLASVSVTSSEVISACGSTKTTSDSLSDLLKLLQPQVLKSKRKAKKKSVNHRTACITNDTLDKLKQPQESQKLRVEEEKVARQLERARKREENKIKKERPKQEREERKKEKEKQEEE